MLEVKNLSISVNIKNRPIKKLTHEASFSVHRGKCLGLLGESGSGKSMTCKAIMGILDRRFKINGDIYFEGVNLLNCSEMEYQEIRGRDICMVLQNPMTSFDPLYRIENQMAETLNAHFKRSKQEIYNMSLDAIKKMKIPNPDEVLKKYPHQLSGGMLQRIMIGLALVVKPKLIIADEPTTALDAITQFEIINEFKRIKADEQTTLIFVSHDLGVLAQLADEVVVMQNGYVVEKGNLNDVFKNPKDKYTQELLNQKMSVMKVFDDTISKNANLKRTNLKTDNLKSSNWRNANDC